MNAKELLTKIEELDNHPRPDKEDWFSLLYYNLETIKEALNPQAQLSAYKAGMTDAAEIAWKDKDDIYSDFDAGQRYAKDVILTARDNKKEL